MDIGKIFFRAFPAIVLSFVLSSSVYPSYTTGSKEFVLSISRNYISPLSPGEDGSGHIILGNDLGMSGVRAAAEYGDAWAQFCLGLMYASTESIFRDEREALKWVTLSALQGLAEAQFKLGTMYYIGEIVPQDEKQAAKWFTKAARRGLPDAQFNLASMYYMGEGVPRDRNEALKWFTRAAEQGDGKAQMMLGRMYLRGEGVSGDIVLAYAWLNLAASSGIERAIKERDALQKGMTPLQIEQACRIPLERRKGK